MLREVMPVAAKEFRNVVGQQIDFPADGFGLVGFDAPKTEVGVEATSDALEEFLVRLPGGGEDEGVVPGKATDETVAGSQGIDGAGIDVAGRDMRRTPDLTGGVIAHGGPLWCGHSGELAVEEYKTLRQVSVVVIRAIGSETGKGTKANTGLNPVGLGAFLGGIVGAEAKVDFIKAGGDSVINDEPIRNGAAEADLSLVAGDLDELSLMGNFGVSHPIGIGRSGPAISLQIFDPDGFSGEVTAVDGQIVIFPGEGKRGTGRISKRWSVTTAGQERSD